MIWKVERVGWIALAAFVSALGSGCVAFNVGKPEVFTHTETVVTTNQTPIRTEVLSVEAMAQADGNQLRAWLDADVKEEFQRVVHEEVVTVKKQRRMAVGLYPAGARVFLAPHGALDILDADPFQHRNNIKDIHGAYWRYDGRSKARCYEYVLYTMFSPKYRPKAGYVFAQTIPNLILLPALFGTMDTLLVEPFSSFGWKKTHEVVDADHVKVSGYGLDASGSPKLKAINRFSQQDRKSMGIRTCFDIDASISRREAVSGIGTCGILGAYKYNTFFVSGPVRDGTRHAGTEEKRRTEALAGPYDVELRIPEAGISTKTTVWAGSSNATFTLPQVDRGGPYEATLEFRSLYTGTEDAVRKSWKTKTLKTTVWLKSKPAPVAVYTPQTQPVREVVREVVREIQYVERRPEGAPWDIETVEPFHDGRAVYLVRILDESKTAANVESEVRPLVERNLRNAFLEAMPWMDEKSVAVTVVADYEWRAIRFRGAAFSAVPLPDSWEYNADTRRGMVRLKLHGGTTIPDMEQWARENIDAIVSSQNIALEAGKESPAGARYRFLDKDFNAETQVLTVEFEAVE